MVCILRLGGILELAERCVVRLRRRWRRRWRIILYCATIAAAAAAAAAGTDTHACIAR